MRRRSPTLPAVHRRPSGRLLWTVVAAVALAVVIGYALGAGPTAGGLVAVALTAAVLVVLTVRRRRGALARTLAEYGLVAALIVSLATLTPAGTADRRPAAPAVQGDGVAVVLRAPGNVRDWLVDAWQRANELAGQRAAPPPDQEGGSS